MSPEEGHGSRRHLAAAAEALAAEAVRREEGGGEGEVVVGARVCV